MTSHVSIMESFHSLLDPVLYLRMYEAESLIYTMCPIKLFIPQLKINIRLPSLLFRLPFHPALKDL